MLVVSYLLVFRSHCQRKLPLNKLWEQLLSDESDHHHPVLTDTASRPILVTLDHPVLHGVRHHDDDVDVLLPDHPPEVGGGVGKGTLRGNVLILVSVALQQIKLMTS